MKKFGKVKHIHLIGIGGIGMSGIAELLINQGFKVSGSDINDSKVITYLSKLGAHVYVGHRAENVKGADVVVYSSAVFQDNPEIVEARNHFIPVIPRAEMLAELMRNKYGIAIAGAHGKTTTTTMVASIVSCGHLDPTVIIGGRLDIWGGSNAKPGQSDLMVAEADESDGSFLVLSPTIAVVTNIDNEHMNHYGNMDAIRDTFVTFINKIPFYGTAILCLDDPEIHGIIPRLKKRYLSYGLSSQADLRGVNINKEGMGTSFEIIYRNKFLGRVKVSMPGDHNVLNALAAAAVGFELNLDIPSINEGLENIGGLERRFQIKGEKDGVLILDDYGHHPTEIMATLKTVKECWPERRLIVIFQPHRYSRTEELFERFLISFNEADVLRVLPIYSAGEPPSENVTSESLAKGIREHGHKDVDFADGHDDAVDKVVKIMKSGDLVMTLGAGNVYQIGERLLG